MQTNQPRERKRKPFLWILSIVAVLLTGVIGIYSRYMWMHPPQVRTPVVARGKIPAPPPPPVMEARPGSSTTEVSEPPAEADSPESMSEVAAAPQLNASADSRSAPADDAQQNVAAGPTDDQASAPGAGDAPPATTAVGELQAAVQETPEISPSSDTVPSPPADPSAARTEPTPPPESPDVAETPAPYAIQVGAYRSKSNADRQIGQLQEKGFDAYLYEKNDKDQRVWYFVRFGRFDSFKAAQQALTAFKKQEMSDGAVVRSKPN